MGGQLLPQIRYTRKNLCSMISMNVLISFRRISYGTIQASWLPGVQYIESVPVYPEIEPKSTVQILHRPAKPITVANT